MNNTTVNYTSPRSTLSTTTAPAAIKQIAAQNAKPVESTVTAAPVAKADQTRISTASALITKTLSLPDVRQDKVAGLQKAINEGTYHVSSSDVAGKLLKSLLG